MSNNNNDAIGYNAFPSMGGDVTGQTNKATVVGIQTIPVSSTAPTNIQVLEYVAANSQWQPMTVNISTIVGAITYNMSSFNTSSYTIQPTDIVLVDTTSNNANPCPPTTINFPSTSPVGRIIFYLFCCPNTKYYYYGGGVDRMVNFTAGAGSKINGVAVYNMYVKGAVTTPANYFVCYDGVNWMGAFR